MFGVIFLINLQQHLCARTIVNGVFNNDYEPKIIIKYTFNNDSDTDPLLKTIIYLYLQI
jgi:hypothetical protein